MDIHQYLAANCSLRRNKCLHISFTIPLLMPAEFLVDKFGISHPYKSVGFYYSLKQLITIAWLSVFELFCYFFYQKKNYLLAYVTLLTYVIRTNQIAALGYVSHTDQISAFGYIAPLTAFGYCFLVNDVMELGGRAQSMTFTINFGLF